MSSASAIQRSSGESGFFDEIEDKSFSGERGSDSGQIQGNCDGTDVEVTDRTGEYSVESDFSIRSTENENDFLGSNDWGAEDIEDDTSSCTSDGDRSTSLADIFKRQGSRISEETESELDASRSDQIISSDTNSTNSGGTSCTGATNGWIGDLQGAQRDEAERHANEVTYLKCVQGEQLSDDSPRVPQADEKDSGRKDAHDSDAVHPTGSIHTTKPTGNLNFDGEVLGDPVVSQVSKWNRSSTTLDQKRAAAAKTIQREVRGRYGLKRGANVRGGEQGDAAARIQALVRGRQLRRKGFRQTTEEPERYRHRRMIAMTQIQREVRRRQGGAIATRRVVQEHGAAKRIQAVARGWHARLKGHIPLGHHTKKTIVPVNADGAVRVAHAGRLDPDNSKGHGTIDGNDTVIRIQKQTRRSIAKEDCAFRSATLSPGQSERIVNELDNGAERFGETFLAGKNSLANKRPQGQTGQESGTAYSHETQDTSSARRGQVPLEKDEAAEQIQRLNALREHDAVRRIQKQARRSIAKKDCAFRSAILAPDQTERTLNELENGVERYGETFLSGRDSLANKRPQGQMGRENGTAYRHERQDMSSARRGQVSLEEVEAIQRQMKRKIRAREWQEIPVIRQEGCTEADDADAGCIRSQEIREGIDISRVESREGREGKVFSTDETHDELHDFHPETERRTPRQLPPLGEQSLGLASPDKVAPAAAAVAAKATAEAVAVCVRAEEDAADAVSAAVIIADAEEEAKQLSLAQSVFRAIVDSRTKSASERHSISPNRKASPETRGATDGDKKGGRIREEALSRRAVRDHVGQDDLSGEGRGRSGEDDALKSARIQARKYARERKARDRKKQEGSRRHLRAVEAELVKAEELRAKQEASEKATLEAKRARILEGTRRRQKRQAQSRSKAPSSVGSGCEGQSTRAWVQDCDDPRKISSEDIASLSPLRSLREGLQAKFRRNHGRHVSVFRQRILEERRVYTEAVELKQEELKQKAHRQSGYGAKIRAEARKTLATVRLRRQARGRPLQADQSVVRMSVITKAPSRSKSGTKERGTGGSQMHDSPAVWFGSTGRVHTRPEMSEVIERIERAGERATEANRAQRMTHCWRRRQRRRKCGGADDVNWRYVQPRAAEGAGLEGEKPKSFITYISEESKGRIENTRYCHSRGSHRPGPLSQRGVGGGTTNDRNCYIGGSRYNHGGNVCTGRSFGRGEQAKAHNGQSTSDDIHAMYEERLAALERRVATGCKYRPSLEFKASSRNEAVRRGIGARGLEPNVLG